MLLRSNLLKLMISIMVSIVILSLISSTINYNYKLQPTQLYLTQNTTSKIKEKPYIISSEKGLMLVKRFETYEELKSFIAEAEMARRLSWIPIAGALLYGEMRIATPTIPTMTATSIPFSKTNVQVVGVDEADIVKTDGEYIYLASGDELFIVKAYPPEDAKLITKVKLNKELITGIFINNNKLIILASVTERKPTLLGMPATTEIITIPTTPITKLIIPNTTIHVYDITNKEKPVSLLNLTITGTYVTSRMIDKYVYIIVHMPLYKDQRNELVLPVINGKPVSPSEILYFEGDYSYSFTIILALDLETLKYNKEVFLLGKSSYIYVSLKNLYILVREYIKPLKVIEKYIEIVKTALPQNIQKEIDKILSNYLFKDYEKYGKAMNLITEWFNKLPRGEREKYMIKIISAHKKALDLVYGNVIEKTIIYRFSLDGLNINIKAKGTVPGRVLDQFSMDEYNSYFRIATTSRIRKGHEVITTNNVYVLDMNLTVIGKLEELAPGERIYSARYLGNIMFLVTFRRIDPLFGIDLSVPKNPKVIGYLKIPGYSEYLHPYKERYLIGIGREATEQGRLKGIKVSLFDISNITNIREVSKIEIGTRRTWSPILTDHKAFMINEYESYIAIPVRGDINGAYVIDVVKGNLVVRGFIEHKLILRTMYIGDYIYTISPYSIKVVNENIELIKTINLEKQ